MNDTIRYIISFLLYDNTDAIDQVGYTRDQTEAANYKINILPSQNSPLYDPQKSWEDFMPEVETMLTKKSLSDNDDLISLACFYISRAEEIVNTERDEHGRLLASHSLAGKHQLLNIPLLDEYARRLLKRLNLPMPPRKARQINLTHDVDVLEQYRHLRGFLGGIKRMEIKPLYASIRNLTNDSAWTFPWLMQQDKDFNTIYFIKAGCGKAYDYPQYNLKGKDFHRLLQLLRQNNSTIGLHLSYTASDRKGTDIIKEKQLLEEAISQPVTCNRYHWLRIQSIDNMQKLCDAGITDDYSMGFADYAGFRMLTSRPVRWINPKTLQLTQLTLHPLLIMDCTFSNANYMNLTEDEAYYTCQQLIDKAQQNNGEINLLWHNHIFAADNYHKSLYISILNYLKL